MLKRTSNRYFSAWFLVLVSAILLGGSASSAYAQDMDEDDTSDDGSSADVPMAEEAPVDPDAVKHGIGLRLRYVFMPKALIQIFMEEAAGGMGHGGYGLEYVRRKKNVELSVGIEYDKLSGTEGYYIESGGATNEAGTIDFVEFDNLAWITLDAAIVYHHPLTSMVSLRYGGGIGLGVVTGEVIKTDAACNGPNAQDDCVRLNNPAGELNEKQDFFRFPPVFNLLGGVQVTPVRNVAINFEIGMRTIFYSGITGHYYF